MFITHGYYKCWIREYSNFNAKGMLLFSFWSERGFCRQQCMHDADFAQWLSDNHVLTIYDDRWLSHFVLLSGSCISGVIPRKRTNCSLSRWGLLSYEALLTRYVTASLRDRGFPELSLLSFFVFGSVFYLYVRNDINIKICMLGVSPDLLLFRVLNAGVFKLAF